MFLLKGYLVIPILHVKDRPDLESALTLEDVPNPGEGVGVYHCDLIQPSVVHNQPVFPWPLLGNGEGGAAPWSLAGLNFAVGNELVSEANPCSPFFPNHLIGSLFDRDCAGLQHNLGFPERSSFGGTPGGLAAKN